MRRLGLFFSPRAGRVALALAVLSITTLLRGEVALSPLFSDGAVLQCDKPIPVWGTAAAGERVTLTFSGQTRTATGGADGRWIALFDPLPATPVGAELTAVGSKNTVVARDIVIGEVWLCSGQSNMEWPVSRAANAAQEIAAAQFPLIRHLKVERQTSDVPLTHFAGSGWKTATPANVAEFTAVGYFFAREIHQRLGVPVGIINSSWGGTPIEAWMSPAALASRVEFAVVQERWREATATYPIAKTDHDTQLASWIAAEATAKTRGEKAYAAWLRDNPRPKPPHGAPGDPWAPTGLFNGMINPLLPSAMRGVLWYQGESNTGRPSEYQALFSEMITAWRAHLGQGDIPFYWVNLAAFRPNDSTDMAYARLREAQTKTLPLPNTGQAVAIDIGEPEDIHPKNKQEVGRRLALLAKKRVYGIVTDDTGPTFASAEREGSAMRVRFNDVSAGLISQERPPQALELAGPDRQFKPAVGRIDRDTLVVTSPEVREPVAVRYAWRNAPDANLFSGSGLPVVPFRSDDW